METITVECIRRIPAAPEAVWGTVRDFRSNWHPAVSSSTVVTSSGGWQIREFTDGDGKLYRERLTYFSDSDQTFRYTLIDGIDGLDQYQAATTLEADEDDGTLIVWTVEIVAPSERVHAIAEGTRAIFEAGLDHLCQADFPNAPPGEDRDAPVKVPAELTRHFIGELPRLSLLSTSAKQSDVLVLFLHGIGGNAENWRSQLQVLGKEHNAATLDMRGYGESTLGEGASRIADYCADILTVMKATAAARLVLVGLSMGSWIATSFAMRYPDYLARLVLAGGCTGMSEAEPEEREAFRSSRAVPLSEGLQPADFAPAVVDIIAGPNATEIIREELAASMSAIPTKSYLDALNCFCAPEEVFDFSKISCPILLMTGEHDRLALPDEIRGVGNRLHADMPVPDVRFEVHEGAGHVCNLKAPDAFNTALKTFLANIPAR